MNFGEIQLIAACYVVGDKDMVEAKLLQLQISHRCEVWLHSQAFEAVEFQYNCLGQNYDEF